MAWERELVWFSAVPRVGYCEVNRLGWFEHQRRCSMFFGGREESSLVFGVITDILSRGDLGLSAIKCFMLASLELLPTLELLLVDVPSILTARSTLALLWVVSTSPEHVAILVLLLRPFTADLLLPNVFFCWIFSLM